MQTHAYRWSTSSSELNQICTIHQNWERKTEIEKYQINEILSILLNDDCCSKWFNLQINIEQKRNKQTHTHRTMSNGSKTCVPPADDAFGNNNNVMKKKREKQTQKMHTKKHLHWINDSDLQWPFSMDGELNCNAYDRRSYLLYLQLMRSKFVILRRENPFNSQNFRWRTCQNGNNGPLNQRKNEKLNKKLGIFGGIPNRARRVHIALTFEWSLC